MTSVSKLTAVLPEGDVPDGTKLNFTICVSSRRAGTPLARTDMLIATHPGDLDLDLDGGDFLIWQRGGTADMATDYADWEANFGAVAPAVVAAKAATIPEPNTFMLIAIGLASFGVRMRHTHEI